MIDSSLLELKFNAPVLEFDDFDVELELADRSDFHFAAFPNFDLFAVGEFLWDVDSELSFVSFVYAYARVHFVVAHYVLPLVALKVKVAY